MMRAPTVSLGRRVAIAGHRPMFAAVRQLTVGVVTEPGDETRVALVPAVAKHFIKEGYTVQVEKGAGVKAGFPDSQYKEAGCIVADRQSVIKEGKVFFSINPPPNNELSQFGGKTVVGWVGRLLPSGKEIVEAAAAAKVQLIDTTAAPRITIAQKLDVLSSQAKLAGHRAVLEAAYVFQRFHAPEITAAGKYPPANTMVLGCGVAGLAAMGTSKACPVRPSFV